MKEYRFVNGIFTHEIEIKRSRFIATVCGEVDIDTATKFVDKVKKTYPDARHNCYAYIADENGNAMRFSDDGEPSGTAGQPMLEVLKKSGLKKTAVVVTRYFGGIKLGAAGLLSAYTRSVSEALDVATVAVKRLANEVEVKCAYSSFATLESYLRSDEFAFSSVEFGDDVRATIFVPDETLDGFRARILSETGGMAEIEVKEKTYVPFNG